MMQQTLTVILAGGRGSRLEPLTRDRAKPAVPIGGCYRIIDFVLSNCLNSGMRRVLMLTQYKAQSLDRHIQLAWTNYFCRELGEFIDVVPPQQRIDDNWYQGTADAVYQNIYAIERELPEYVVVLAGDHLYKMNYRSMVDFHRCKGADITVGALSVDRREAHQFGVMQVDENDRLVEFQEKPEDPQGTLGNPDVCLASMGIYVFSTRYLFERLCDDATDPNSSHDFGKDIIPAAITDSNVFAFPFTDENRKSDAYWRDVGTIEAYYEANMDLVRVDPQLNLYDSQWPIRSFRPQLPPPKFVFGSDGGSTRQGVAMDSIICQGAIISGGSVMRSIIGAGCRIRSYSQIEDSILFDDVEVGRHSRIRRAIIDKGVRIPPEMEIGYDPVADAERGLRVTETGLVVIARGELIPTQDSASSLA
ncbi:glucose-1-phosphate adenylyltransferase [Allorhodopirellula solitaria]|uniref:Glucose-1-phosphate adenylyltransferase n=1 Tax=Allorhodopirellula solitaria TaxID=2527987 RepID=A0A5C5YGC9_9BACT|nr:glucose-1-phosphate adenylyltransferase [Allorhodopirellula solitaria]TWT73953.1 Glucose-1-phosphate adenylyltransferase [Allorhodopirellula solitaria]